MFGKISSSGSIGGIVALLMGESNEIVNNYWLNNCGANYGISANGSVSNDGAESKTNVELKEMANILGEEYVADGNNLNNGYPYLIKNMPSR